MNNGKIRGIRKTITSLLKLSSPSHPSPSISGDLLYVLPSLWGHTDSTHHEEARMPPTLAQVKDLIKYQSVLMQNGKCHIDGAPEDNTRLQYVIFWHALCRNTRVLYRQVMKKQKGHLKYWIIV